MPGSAKASAKALAASIYTLSVAKDQDVVAGIRKPSKFGQGSPCFLLKPMQPMSSPC